MSRPACSLGVWGKAAPREPRRQTWPRQFGLLPSRLSSLLYKRNLEPVGLWLMRIVSLWSSVVREIHDQRAGINPCPFVVWAGLAKPAHLSLVVSKAPVICKGLATLPKAHLEAKRCYKRISNEDILWFILPWDCGEAQIRGSPRPQLQKKHILRRCQGPAATTSRLPTSRKRRFDTNGCLWWCPSVHWPWASNRRREDFGRSFKCQARAMEARGMTLTERG